MPTDMTRLRDLVWGWVGDVECFCADIDTSDRLQTQQKWNARVEAFRHLARWMDEAGELTGFLRPLWASCAYMQVRGHDGSGYIDHATEVCNPADLKDIAERFCEALVEWLHFDQDWLPPGERPPKLGHEWRGMLAGNRYALAELPVSKDVTR